MSLGLDRGVSRMVVRSRSVTKYELTICLCLGLMNSSIMLALAFFLLQKSEYSSNFGDFPLDLYCVPSATYFHILKLDFWLTDNLECCLSAM